MREHVEFLTRRVGDMRNGINLLVVGYSALDTAVIQELTAPGRKLRNLLVVDRDRDSASAIAATLRQSFGQGTLWTDAFDGSFGTFVRGTALDDFLTTIAAPASTDVPE